MKGLYFRDGTVILSDRTMPQSAVLLANGRVAEVGLAEGIVCLEGLFRNGWSVEWDVKFSKSLFGKIFERVLAHWSPDPFLYLGIKFR